MSEDHAGRALRESEGRFRALAEAAREAIIVHEDGVIREVNRAFTTLFGYTRDEIIGKCGLRVMVAQDSRDEVSRSIQSEGSGGTSSVVCITKSGERRVVESSSEAITYQGRPMRVVTMQDLTARIEAEEARQRSEERFRFALNAAEIGTWDWSILDDVAQWSPEAHAILGRDSELGGGSARRFLAVVHEDDRSAVEAVVAETVRTRRPDFRVEHRVVWRDGRVRWVEERGRLFVDDAGRAVRMAGTVSDVTRRRELEEQLVHSQRMEAMGRLAGGVAHDFNNLLTIILSYTEITLAELDDAHPRATASLTQVRAATERAAALTRQLLIFARREISEAEVVDLGALVTNAGHLLARVMGEDVTVTVDIVPGLWRARVDASQCEQVLMNLAVNARDAMPHGGALHVRARNVAASVERGDSVVLEIEDTGTGMEDDVRRHAFEPFFTTKSAGKGTGLGLPICHAVVTRAGGEIDVQSSPGAGTTFRIFLPRCDAAEAKSAAAPRLAAVMGGRETILLVEDDDAVRALAARVLDERGYTLIVARSGAEALAQAEAHDGRIDLVLTDVVMPGMSGPRLVDALRACRPAAGARVMYMSGYTGDEIAGEAVGGGHADAEAPPLLPKPYSPERLARRVREVLDAPLQPSPTDAPASSPLAEDAAPPSPPP
jgi:two-component system cell cycle sensor histidine kinase/response regulator CckA